MVNGKSRFLIRRGSLTAACGAAIVLVIVLAGAATIVKPLPTDLPAGTAVSPADTSGVNLLEPANAAISSEVKGKSTGSQGVERVVGEWTPTSGGGGGGGSPKS
jgi:hypothetical protein